MKFGTGSTTELTQKREGQSTKMPYVRPYIYTNKHPRFFHFYPCKCLARQLANCNYVCCDIIVLEWKTKGRED